MYFCQLSKKDQQSAIKSGRYELAKLKLTQKLIIRKHNKKQERRERMVRHKGQVRKGAEALSSVSP